MYAQEVVALILSYVKTFCGHRLYENIVGCAINSLLWVYELNFFEKSK